jgi:hypothetical protein
MNAANNDEVCTAMVYAPVTLNYQVFDCRNSPIDI